MIIVRGLIDDKVVIRGFGPGVEYSGPGFYTLPVPRRIKVRYDFEIPMDTVPSRPSIITVGLTEKQVGIKNKIDGFVKKYGTELNEARS